VHRSIIAEPYVQRKYDNKPFKDALYCVSPLNLRQRAECGKDDGALRTKVIIKNCTSRSEAALVFLIKTLIAGLQFAILFPDCEKAYRVQTR
jgi:hypothetical protein